MMRMISHATLLAAASLALSAAASALAPARAPMVPRAVGLVVPVVSSDAHKGINGNYGVYKYLKSGPTAKAVRPKSEASKPPYPYRYYKDTSRGNYGCHRYGRRAIDTDNANWWNRYRACTEVGRD